MAAGARQGWSEFLGAFVLQSDVDFVQENLRVIEQNLLDCGQNGETEDAQEQETEHFKAIQLCFDEVIERLPACGPLLAHIKKEYERVFDQLVASRQEAAALTHRLHVKDTEVGTIRNYHHQLKELEVKLANINANNVRITNEIERMRKERETAFKNRECKLEEMRRMKPKMTSARRRTLRLSMEEATSVTQLQKELQRTRLELEEAREVTQRRYVPVQKKHTLQHHLKEKAEVRRELALQNQYLSSLLKNLKTAIEAAKSYSSSVRKQETDPTQLDVADYILTKIRSSPAPTEEITDDELEDPVKEKETEMILDCFEKFNKLFESEQYEEAALHAATSPKGVLRTLEVLQKFKSLARQYSGRRLPLLSYCEALMQSAAAYRPVTPEESLECAKCALEQGEISSLTHWIAQKSLPPSKEVAVLIFQHCKCDRRCICGCMSLAFSQLEKSGLFYQAAICLVYLGRFVSFLALTQKVKFSGEDYASILYTVPSLQFAKCLVLPPKPYSQCLTVFEAMHLLLRARQTNDSLKLFKDYLKESGLECTQAVMDDVKTSWEVWQSLLACLEEAGLSDMALELFSLLTVRVALSQAKANLLQELAAYIHSLQDCEEQQDDTGSVCSYDAESGSRVSGGSSQSVSGSGYSSSSQDTDDVECPST